MFLALQRAPHRLVQRLGPRHGARFGHAGGLAQVHDVDRRQRPIPDAPGEREDVQPSGLSPVQCLERWRRAPQEQPSALEARAHGGDVARVVARGRPLLVARLVLFVHDDGAEALDRREDRRPGADRDAPLAAAQRAPRVGALAVGKS